MRFLRRDEPSSLSQVLGALAFVVLAIKAGKLAYKFVDDYGLRPVHESWLVRGALMALACWTVSRLRILELPRLRRFRPLLIALPALVVLAGKLALAILTGDAEHAYGWIVSLLHEGAFVGRVLYNAFRLDVLFLSAFALVAHALTWAAPERWRPRVTRAIGAVVALCVVFCGLELAQYMKTRTPATGQLMGYFVANARGMSAMVLSQVDRVTISAMLAPIVVGLAIARLTPWQPAPAKSPKRTAAILGALILATGLVHLARIDHQFDQTCDDTFLALRDLAPWRTNGEVQAKRRASQMPLLFDTRRAALRPRGEPPRKNVIVIMLESTRAASTSLYNPTLNTTPFMVELARRGAVISTMYAGAPRTNGAWMQAINGVYAASDAEMEDLAKSHPRTLSGLPTLLEPLGYASAFFTSAFLDFMYDRELVRAMRFGVVQDGKSLPHEGFEQVSYTGYEDRQVVRPALSWVREQARAHRPFFLMWMTNVGHFPFTPPTSWPSLPFAPRDETEDRYLNCLGYVDTIVGELVGGLDALGVMENSILLLLGDHGESMGEHGPRVHTLCIYDETLRIPAVLYAPGQIRPGSTIDGLRQEIDILPTFADLLGLELERATLPGVPLTGPVPADRTLYFGGEEGAQFLAMRRGAMKFIYSYDRSPTEAYDLVRDPTERHNLAASVAPKVIEDIEADLLAWHERVSLATAAPPAP